MKIPPTLLAGSMLAFGASLILAPPSDSAEKKTRLSPVEEEFIQHEVGVGKTVIKVANEAAKRAKSENLRTFALMLVKDHEKSNAELAKLAESKGVDTESGHSKSHDPLIERLMEGKDEDFDKEFVALVVKLHKESIENFEKTSTDSPDTDLKDWATRKLPGLKAHLERATELSSAETASARAPSFIVL